MFRKLRCAIFNAAARTTVSQLVPNKLPVSVPQTSPRYFFLFLSFLLYLLVAFPLFTFFPFFMFLCLSFPLYPSVSFLSLLSFFSLSRSLSVDARRVWKVWQPFKIRDPRAIWWPWYMKEILFLSTFYSRKKIQKVSTILSALKDKINLIENKIVLKIWISVKHFNYWG